MNLRAIMIGGQVTPSSPIKWLLVVGLAHAFFFLPQIMWPASHPRTAVLPPISSYAEKEGSELCFLVELLLVRRCDDLRAVAQSSSLVCNLDNFCRGW